MLIAVRHVTRYHFDAPMRFVTQSHRLTPADHAGQKVREWEVTAEGAEFGAAFVDGAGDPVRAMTVQGPVEAVEIVVRGVVETSDTAGVLRGRREIVSPLVYRQPTPATAANGALADLAGEALRKLAPDEALARAHALAAAVSKAVEYAPGSTESGTSAAEALETGRGVCQDHAHVLIALALASGLSARYVAGYLLSGEDGAPEEASHAWAEIFVDGLGWVGFDAANACCPDARYIRLGSGRDAAQAAPIRGVSRGGGVESMDVSVVVAERRDQSQEQRQQ